MPRGSVEGSGGITVRRLSSGYYHVRGRGPCNWSQPPRWPCSEEELREHAFPEAGEEFLRRAGALARKEAA
jgi:hypothetical protein